MSDAFPLTEAQALIRTGQLLSGDAPIYNMAWRFDLLGVIDDGRFVQAANAMAALHDGMRLVFTEQDGAPVQVTGDPPRWTAARSWMSALLCVSRTSRSALDTASASDIPSSRPFSYAAFHVAVSTTR